MLRIFLQNRQAALALGFLVIISVIAILAPWIAPYSPNETHADNPQDILAFPSHTFLLGTDQLGRDSFSRLIWGLRTSLFVASFSGLGILLIALPVGFLAGYFGGRIDAFLMRIVDVFFVIPPFFLILLLVAIFGSSQAIVIVVLSGTLWPMIARLARAETLSHRQRDYVLAALSIGAKDSHILIKHIVPNSLVPVVIGLAGMMADVVLSEAALGYIGVGDPSVVSIGQLLADAQKYMYSSWLLPVIPGLAIALSILCINLVGDGLTDALARGSRR